MCSNNTDAHKRGFIIIAYILFIHTRNAHKRSLLNEIQSAYDKLKISKIRSVYCFNFISFPLRVNRRTPVAARGLSLSGSKQCDFKTLKHLVTMYYTISSRRW